MATNWQELQQNRERRIDLAMRRILEGKVLFQRATPCRVLVNSDVWGRRTFLPLFVLRGDYFVVEKSGQEVGVNRGYLGWWMTEELYRDCLEGSPWDYCNVKLAFRSASLTGVDVPNGRAIDDKKFEKRLKELRF